MESYHGPGVFEVDKFRRKRLIVHTSVVGVHVPYYNRLGAIRTIVQNNKL